MVCDRGPKFVAGALTAVLVASLFVVQAAPAAQAGQTADGKVTMENKTSSLSVDLYIDGKYAGSALGGLPCTASVSAGKHTLEAKTSDGRSVSRELEVESGEEYTWTISEKD